MAGKELKGREKVVSKMTRDGLTEENLADGSVKDISHKSRGRPLEMKQDFVFDREKKKDKLSDGQSEERNLQKKQIGSIYDGRSFYYFDCIAYNCCCWNPRWICNRYIFEKCRYVYGICISGHCF